MNYLDQNNPFFLALNLLLVLKIKQFSNSNYFKEHQFEFKHLNITFILIAFKII